MAVAISTSPGKSHRVLKQPRHEDLETSTEQLKPARHVLRICGHDAMSTVCQCKSCICKLHKSFQLKYLLNRMQAVHDPDEEKGPEHLWQWVEGRPTQGEDGSIKVSGCIPCSRSCWILCTSLEDSEGGQILAANGLHDGDWLHPAMYCTRAVDSPGLPANTHFGACPSPCPGQNSAKNLEILYSDSTLNEFFAFAQPEKCVQGPCTPFR